jgi:hypothetical protein
MIRMTLCAWVTLIVAASTASAADWATEMFAKTSHDFGTIARGAKAEYRFVLENSYVDDVHISGARVSCGCTTPKIEKEWLKTYEKGVIIATINSQKFLGRQQSTITVTIDKPLYAQVQLHVKVYIRSDVTLEPPSVVLGSFDSGSAVEKTITARHTSSSDWQIVEVKSGNPHLSAEAVETQRGDGQVAYQVKVRLDKSASPGYIREHLVLVTNDQRSREIPLLVEGQVLSELVIRPSPLFLGSVRPGERVTKQIVVRGKKPFRITSVSGDCQCLQFTVPDKEPAKPLHLVPVTFTASDKAGSRAPTIRVETDLHGAKAEVTAYVVVTPTE